MLENCGLYTTSLLALLCVGKEAPRNPPALHAGPLRFFYPQGVQCARTKKALQKNALLYGRFAEFS